MSVRLGVLLVMRCPAVPSGSGLTVGCSFIHARMTSQTKSHGASVLSAVGAEWTPDARYPALISADEAAREIIAGLEQGRFEIHFPRRFTLWLKILRLLPYRWYFALVRKGTGL